MERREFLKFGAFGLGALLTAPIIGCGDSSNKEADAGLDMIVDSSSPDLKKKINLKPLIARKIEDDQTGHVKDIDPKDFDYEVLQAFPPVLVDFYAPWCGPCKYMAPIFEDLAKICVGMKFVTVDMYTTKEGNAIAEDYGVFAIPNYQFFHQGEWHPEYGVVGARVLKLQKMIGLFFKDHGITDGVVYPDAGVEPDASVNDASSDLLLDAGSDLSLDASSDLSKKLDVVAMNYDPELKQFEGHYCDIKTRTLHKVK